MWVYMSLVFCNIVIIKSENQLNRIPIKPVETVLKTYSYITLQVSIP